MKSDGGNNLGNLPNLGAQLLKIELEHIKDDDGTAAGVRESIMEALPQYRNSRYQFGKLLSAYKVFFIEEGGWLATAAAIGEALGCDERTVRRIAEDYDRASKLPVEALDALQTQGIDPAAKKNAPLLKIIHAMPPGDVKAEPEKAVTQAIKTVKAAKAGKKAETTKKPSQSVSVPSDTQLVLLSREEKQLRDLRQRIRAGLTDVPNDRKLAVLVAAIEEEMYEVWGERVAQEITLTPRPSALTLDGRRKLEDAA